MPPYRTILATSLGLLLPAAATLPGCESTPTPTSDSQAPVAAQDASRHKPTTTGSYQATADLVRLDALCFAMTMEMNSTLPADRVQLICRYRSADSPAVHGEEVTAETFDAAFTKMVQRIEQKGKASLPEPSTLDEALVSRLDRLADQLEARCWYVKYEKTGQDWRLMAREDLGGRASNTAFADGSDLEGLFQNAIKQLDEKRASARAAPSVPRPGVEAPDGTGFDFEGATA